VPPPAAPTRPDASALVSPGATAPPARPLDLPSATPPARHAAATGSTEQPGAVLPQQTRPAAPSIQRRPPSRRLEPGDLICPECGEGNPPTRKFCSRCGTSVADAEVVKAKWWKKLLPRRGPKRRKAGARPSARKTRKSFPAKIMGVLLGGVGRVVGVIMLVAGLVYGIVPNIRDSVNEQFSSISHTIKGWISPSYSEVHPAAGRVKATPPGGTQPGALAVDGHKNTFWLTPQTKGQEPVLVVAFADKIDLSRIIIYNGIGEGALTSAGKPAAYLSYARPSKLHLVFDNGKATDVTIKDDTPAPHTISVSNGSGIRRVEIHLPELYQAANPGRPIAITEIEFFRKD
jgi:hypothetical protein